MTHSHRVATDFSLTDSHRNTKAASATYPLLSEQLCRSCVTEGRSGVLRPWNFHAGVAEGRRGSGWDEKAIKSSEAEESRENCSNGEGGGRWCKLESGRSKHFYSTQL